MANCCTNLFVLRVFHTLFNVFFLVLTYIQNAREQDVAPW